MATDTTDLQWSRSYCDCLRLYPQKTRGNIKINLDSANRSYGFDVWRQSLAVSSATFGVAALHSDSYLPGGSGRQDHWGWVVYVLRVIEWLRYISMNQSLNSSAKTTNVNWFSKKRKQVASIIGSNTIIRSDHS